MRLVLRPISPPLRARFATHGISFRSESALCSWLLSPCTHCALGLRAFPPCFPPLAGSPGALWILSWLLALGPVSPHVPLIAPATLLTPVCLFYPNIRQPDPVCLKQGTTWPDGVLQERLDLGGPVRSPSSHLAASAGFSLSWPCARGLQDGPRKSSHFVPAGHPSRPHTPMCQCREEEGMSH